MDTFYDLQVNGYGGVDFNQDDLTADQLNKACELLAAHSSGGILATIVTEDLDTMARRLERLVELREQSPLAKRIVAGIHIEGPFINPSDGYRGAHARDAIRPADVDSMQQLLDAGSGLTRLVTLAPECDANRQVTRMLARQGITVAAGHTDASFDELSDAIDAGLTLFTHLGNGCPMQIHRHDNIIQRALSLAGKDRLTPCFIADGVHIPFFVLANYLTIVDPDRCIIVTDAVSPAGLGPGRYKVARWDLLIGDDMVARAPDGSHFVGAAITMPQTVKNLRTELGLSAEVVHAMTNSLPRMVVFGKRPGGA